MSTPRPARVPEAELPDWVMVACPPDPEQSVAPSAAKVTEIRLASTSAWSAPVQGASLTSGRDPSNATGVELSG